MGEDHSGEETVGEYSYDYSFEAHGETVHVGAHLVAHDSGVISTPIHWRVGETEGTNGWFEYSRVGELDNDLPGAAFIFATEPGEEPRFNGQPRLDVEMPTEVANQLTEDKDEVLEQHRESLIPERREIVTQDLMDLHGVDSREELPEGWEDEVDGLMEKSGFFSESSTDSDRS